MATAKKRKKKANHLPVLDHGAVLITIAEYVRRINAARLKEDPLSPLIYHATLHRLINRGDIDTVAFGPNRFIDWNKYQHWVFRTCVTDARRKKVLEASK